MVEMLKIPATELFALIAAVGFAAGLNLYATVAALGLLARFGNLPLPPGLQLLESWPVIVASASLSGVSTTPMPDDDRIVVRERQYGSFCNNSGR